VLVLLPVLAIRSAQRLRAADRPRAPALPPRDRIWLGALISLSMLFLLSWLTANAIDYHIFAAPPPHAAAVGATAVAFALVFALRAISRALRTDEERRKMTVYRIAPRTTREWVLWTLAVMAASVAEEAAYRGVAMSILWYWIGSAWIAALVSSIAFAVAHWTQGFKSLAVIFGIALVMHGLVAVTGTLVYAMFVHAGYDYVAGGIIARDAARFDREAVNSQPV